MTAVWNKISNLAEEFKSRVDSSGYSITTNLNHNYNWHNELWASSRYRRAHIEIVDFRETHNIYILHSTIFPHFDDPSPIWGFDAVCGPNKITGAFHDFSRTGDLTSFMYLWYKAKVSGLEWNKPRQLPEWAKQIFSPAMIAAGNLQEESEIDQLCNTALTTLDFYLQNIGLDKESDGNYKAEQNRYCYYQKKNPHIIQSMVAMGVPESTMQQFVDKVLFPETD